MNTTAPIQDFRHKGYRMTMSKANAIAIETPDGPFAFIATPTLFDAMSLFSQTRAKFLQDPHKALADIVEMSKASRRPPH